MTRPRLKNSSGNSWIIQKFGGTSIGKLPVQIAEEIIRPNIAKNRLVVVCSARSTGKKATGTTSRLLEAYNRLHAISSATSRNEAWQNELLKEAKGIVHDICTDHVAAVDNAIQQAEMREACRRDLEEECQALMAYFDVAKRFDLEINSRAKDRIVSFGEKLSARFMTHLLSDRQVEAEYIDLAEVLPCNKTRRLDHTFYQEATALFTTKIQACQDRVPVVTGFFGNVPGSLFDGDVGRGYTDLCAALCAVGVQAVELQIWKEVDGIFTADPSKVPTARLIPSISPSEAAELTFYGAEVIHHLTMDQVIRACPPIPTRIKNVRNPRGSGTVVRPDLRLAPSQQIERSHPDGAGTPPASPSALASSSRPSPKRPTAVTIKGRITIINVHSNKRSMAHGFFARVFSILNLHRVSVDLISTSEVHVSMAIHLGDREAERQAFERAVADLQEECGEVSILHDMAILSLIGAEMKNMIGIAGRMFSTLADNRVNIEMISQGASEINISCVIDARDAERAMNVLHTNLFTFLG